MLSPLVQAKMAYKIVLVIMENIQKEGDNRERVAGKKPELPFLGAALPAGLARRKRRD